jgi:Domain of unknown function (DUF4331)
MSHHFDTPTAKEDPRINICDFYLFNGNPGTTVMAMTVNPDAARLAPDTFRDEGIYAFRFDLNGDAREEVTFKVRFGAVSHAHGNEHEHVQTLQLRRATGAEALSGIAGELLLEGTSGQIVQKSGVRVYAGLAPDLFAGDAFAILHFMATFYKENRYDPDAFLNRKNYFDKRNVSVIVIEVPNQLIGKGTVHAWSTVSLYGHAPEVQVSRWGLPLVTHIFLGDIAQDGGKEDLREKFNRSVPADDIANFAPQIASFAQKMATTAGSAVHPAEYAKQIVGRLCPTTLVYELGTEAAFDQAGFNGRALADDVMDVILTLMTNRPTADGVAPDTSRIRTEFPYFGAPFTSAEQLDLKPPAKAAAT